MIETKNSKVYFGNNLDVLPTLEDNSVDSIVTDPPYELGFMGKKWDNSGIAYNVELWKECLRVLKPGGHLLSFGGTRTWHRVAVAIEDAGFEVRDSIAWMYGSGFPKSLDVSKAIDKAAGADREVVTETVSDLFGDREEEKQVTKARSTSGNSALPTVGGQTVYKSWNETAPSTPEAEKWEGWGTALKPAFEPIVVARKPLIGTVDANVLEHGTGALNIDGSRIGTGEGVVTFDRTKRKEEGNAYDLGTVRGVKESGQGRWPANVILDEYSAGLLDEQSEASRFFYCAKASKSDRNEGLEDLPDTHPSEITGRKVGSAGAKNGGYAGMSETPRKNTHPTVKPTALMTYLVKLVTPPNGIVLDPFTGSGSTGKAAILEGFQFIGIELTEDYWPIIKGRLEHAETQLTENQDKANEALF